MPNQTRTQQVVNVMHVLSDVPGGEEFELISRKYPQRSPTGKMSGFEQHTHWCLLTEIDCATVPDDAETISVILHGTAPGEQSSPTELARDLLFDNGLCDQWSYRANVDKDNRFCLEVFPEDFTRRI